LKFIQSSSYKQAQTRRLKDVADIRLNFEDADFWIQRKGSAKSVGKPTSVFDPEHIGIKRTATDKLSSKYLQYVFEYLWMQGKFAQLAKGILNLVHINVNDVRNIPIG
jgi:hypothetical protein